MSALGWFRLKAYRLRAGGYTVVGLLVLCLAVSGLDASSAYQRALSIIAVMVSAVAVVGGILRLLRAVPERD